MIDPNAERILAQYGYTVDVNPDLVKDVLDKAVLRLNTLIEAYVMLAMLYSAEQPLAGKAYRLVAEDLAGVVKILDDTPIFEVVPAEESILTAGPTH